MGNSTTVASVGVWGVFVFLGLNALDFYQPEFYAAVIAGYEEAVALSVTSFLSFLLPNIGSIGRVVSGGESGYASPWLLLKLFAVSVLLFVVLGCGSNGIKAPSSLCNDIVAGESVVEVNTLRLYCFAREELNAVAGANNQTLRDILASDASDAEIANARAYHRTVQDIVKRADSAMDKARAIIDGLDQGNAAAQLTIAKTIMLELI